MVGKLMKHEFIALFKTLVWFIGAVLLLSVLARIAYIVLAKVDFSGGRYGIGVSLSMTFVISMWNLSIFALSGAAAILSLVRFFRSLFTGEGYLTFSLPATPTQLLIAKFLSALIATLACYAVIALGQVIAVPTSEYAWFLDLLPDLFALIGGYFASEPLVGVEVCLLIIALIPSGLLYLYLVASIGQLFTKGRIAITIALYYGFSFAIGMIFMMFLFPFIELAFTSIHALLWLCIVLAAGFDVGSFFIIRYILMHKVNLVV